MTTIRVDDLVYETVDGFDGPIEMPGCAIHCPKCNVFHPASAWTAYETHCDSCGGHPILKCPGDHFFDPYGGHGHILLQVKDIES